MKPEQVIAEISRRTGVTVEASDPILQIAALIDAYRDEDAIAVVGMLRDLRRGVSGLSLRLHRMTIVGLVLGGFFLLTTGGGIGWVLRGEAPLLAGLSAGNAQCEDRADGSRLCWQPTFTRLPRK